MPFIPSFLFVLASILIVACKARGPESAESSLAGAGESGGFIASCLESHTARTAARHNYENLVGRAIARPSKPFSRPDCVETLRIWSGKSEMTLTVAAPRDLELLLSFPRVEDVTILFPWKEPYELFDLSTLQQLPRLRRLTIEGMREGSGPTLAEIAKLKGLTDLKLHSSRGEIQELDATPLRDIPKLDSLALTNLKLKRVLGLGDLTRLVHLDLSGNRLDSLVDLMAFGNLRTLRLNDNQLRDLAPVSVFVGLEVLDASDNAIRDLAPLAELVSLKELELGRNGISELTPLANLTQLVRLGICCNEISDIAPLAPLVELTRLNLSLNRLTSVASLASLRKLEDLALDSNAVEDVGPLGTLVAMKSLSLDGNHIERLAPLASLSAVQALYLAKNRVKDVAEVRSLGALPGINRLRLKDNPVYPLLADPKRCAFTPRLCKAIESGRL